MNSFLHRTWAEINLNALENNLNEIKKIVGNKSIMTVVKANAYGHGDKYLCTELQRLGVKYFAVSNIFEARRLRALGINGEILNFGFTENEYLPTVCDNNIIQSVPDLTYAHVLSEFALHNSCKIRIHVEIDTGMGRTGIFTERELDEILSLKGLSAEGIMTHFSASDSLDGSNFVYTDNQQEKFMNLANGKNLLTHSQNSGGTLFHRNYGGDLVRAGIMLYGYNPNPMLDDTGTLIYGHNPKSNFSLVKLMPVMELKSTIAQVKTFDAGSDISYDRTYTTRRKSKIAIVPVGYADGYPRALSNKGKMLVNKTAVPVVGRVCMDSVMLDVTDTDARPGDIVTVFGSGHHAVSVDIIASLIGTISYEILCGVAMRVPRVIMRDGEVVDVEMYV